MAGAGNAILFVVSLVGLGIISLIYVTFASHYFLTTITESSSGQDEVQYPREGLIEWWWKPIFCIWILAFWVVPLSVLLAPLAAVSPLAFGIVWVTLIWLLFPLSLVSALSTQNWFFFMHPVVMWRMLRHYGAFAYVHLITLASAAACAFLLHLTFTRSLWWGILAVIAIPTALLFYARHWGRFAWLSLNFLPRKRKAAKPGEPTKNDDGVPTMDVQEVEEGIREGHPVGYSTGVQQASPAPAKPVATAPAEDWGDNAPYPVLGEATTPYQDTAEPPLAPLAPAVAQTTAPAMVEEEDEWATDKKPYEMIGSGDFKPNEPTPEDEAKPEADKPQPIGKFYDDRHEREKAAKRKAQAEDTVFALPKQSKQTPTFANALFFGVWGFMVYERTLAVWGNLVVLTLIELVFVFMTVSFFPRLD